MKAFSLIGVDGNAFAIMGYTAKALRRAGLNDKVSEIQNKAQSGNYYHLIAVCDEYVEMANKELGLEEGDESYE